MGLTKECAGEGEGRHSGDLRVTGTLMGPSDVSHKCVLVESAGMALLQPEWVCDLEKPGHSMHTDGPHLVHYATTCPSSQQNLDLPF
jgi:hypothetical protein